MYNAEFMQAEGIGEVLRCAPQDGLPQLRELLFDGERLASMRRNMDRLAEERDRCALPLLLSRLERAGSCAS